MFRQQRRFKNERVATSRGHGHAINRDHLLGRVHFFNDEPLMVALLAFALIASSCVPARPGLAQERPAVPPTRPPAVSGSNGSGSNGVDEAAPGAGEPQEMVQLNFPEEVPLATLVEYVCQRLSINIMFDKGIVDKGINVKAAGEIPAESLLIVLESALKINGLALVEAQATGWKKIIKAEQLASVAPAGDAAEAIRQHGNGTAVTQAFALENTKPQEVETLIKPFLTQPGANTIALAASNTLIVTDYASNLLKIAKWIEYIDKPRAAVTVTFVPIEHQSVSDLGSTNQ